MGWHRDRCQAKARYPSRRLAADVLARRRRDDPAAVDGVNVYRCPLCQGFHLGHVPSMESLRSLAAEIRGFD